jgi:para-aminobenzoate synthetase component 1
MAQRLKELQSGFFDRMDDLGSQRTPFLFVIDFEMTKPLIYPLHALPQGVRFSVPSTPPQAAADQKVPPAWLDRSPMPYPDYLKAFNLVKRHLFQGNSYLVNLTFPTPVRTNLTLDQIYTFSQAPYKLLINGEFVVFSPEPFVNIRDGRIRSFPMKGTIDAGIEDAEQKVLNDPKEAAEHVTIVDLIRNDLSRVAQSVEVTRYRFISRIQTLDREILQVSSEITGKLEDDYHKRLGRIFRELLPAGSVSGAPKNRTVEIISEAEGAPRGYYSGVFGYFDGQNLESAVMIRFIEQTPDGLLFRSGGGITFQSDPESEYQEMLAKVYLQI